MSKADYLKARIGYLKFWLVVVVAASLLLAGWLFLNFSAIPPFLRACQLVTLAILIVAAGRAHYAIIKLIRQLGGGK